MALCAIAPGLAMASQTYEFSTPGGSTGADGPVDATATFTVSGTSIQIVLTNLQTDYRAAGQAISAIQFTTSPSATMTFNSGSGVQVNVDGSGNVTFPSGTGATATSDWGVTTPTSTLTALTGTQPDEMIIGPAASGGNYPNFNGQSQFNPYLQQTATFNLTSSASNVVITSVTFFFGTGPDSHTTGVPGPPPPPVPEPSTTALALTGLGALGFSRLLRCRRRAI